MNKCCFYAFLKELKGRNCKKERKDFGIGLDKEGKVVYNLVR